MQTPKKASLLVIILIVLIDLIGFGIVIPILPYYAQSYGASAFGIGWLMTSYSLMQFIVAPIWGRLSDRHGRRPVLLLSMLGTSVALALCGMATTFPLLIAARVFAGICGANISTAYAYVSDVTSDKDRAKGMGLIGASFGIGFILGPAIGGILSKYGYGAPLFAAAGLSFANLCLAVVVLKEPLRDSKERALRRTGRPGWAVAQQILSEKKTGLPILLFFMTTLAVTQMEVVFGIFLKAKYSYGPQTAGVLLAVIGLVMAVIQGGLIGKLSRKFGEARLISAGSVLCSVGLIFFALAGQPTASVLALIILALGHGILHPSLSSLTSLGALPEQRGITMGVFHSASSLARVLGPPMAGWFYDRVQPAAPFFSGAVLVAGVFVMTLLSLQKKPL